MAPKKFIISGGGTGGHIFPAIAIANALRNKHPQSEFLFIGAKGRMEMEKVPESGYRIEGLWISGLQRKLTLKNLSFPFKLISSIARAKRLIREFKPHLVAGVGGYSSGPVVYAASSMHIPTLIQEQNSYPGITNKLLKNRVDKICVAFDGMERFFPAEKIVLTGNPVRAEVIDIKGKEDEAAKHFNISKDRKTLLVLGGSLGAGTINRSISLGLEKFTDKGIQLIWQTGRSGREDAETAVAQLASTGIVVREFINHMHLAYAAADLVIARAGAITVSELCLVGKPCILVPSPNVAEDHQTKNAMQLVRRKAAVLIPDRKAKEELCSTALELLYDDEQLKILSENIRKMARQDAADRIADVALELMET